MKDLEHLTRRGLLESALALAFLEIVGCSSVLPSGSQSAIQREEPKPDTNGCDPPKPWTRECHERDRQKRIKEALEPQGVREKLGNLVILDLEGNTRNYREKGFPICSYPGIPETVLPNVMRCNSTGIIDYLERDRTPPKPALLSFGRYACSQCKAEIPLINRIYQQYGSKLQVVGVQIVSLDNLAEELEKTRAYLKRSEAAFPNVVMPSENYIIAQVLANSDITQNLLVAPDMSIVHASGRFREDNDSSAYGLKPFLAAVERVIR